MGNLTKLTECSESVMKPAARYLGKLISLKVLSLSRNQLSGQIPSELGGLSNLEELYLNENELSGSIPAVTWRSYETHGFGP